MHSRRLDRGRLSLRRLRQCSRIPQAAQRRTLALALQGRILESTAGSATYDFGARAYVPDLGTFTSLDSVAGSAQNPLTLNRYLYAEADPETLVDPDGHGTPNCDGVPPDEIAQCEAAGGGSAPPPNCDGANPNDVQQCEIAGGDTPTPRTTRPTPTPTTGNVSSGISSGDSAYNACDYVACNHAAGQGGAPGGSLCEYIASASCPTTNTATTEPPTTGSSLYESCLHSDIEGNSSQVRDVCETYASEVSSGDVSHDFPLLSALLGAAKVGVGDAAAWGGDMLSYAKRDPLGFTGNVLTVGITCALFCEDGIEELGRAGAALRAGDLSDASGWIAQAAGPWVVAIYQILSGDEADPGPIAPYVPVAQPAPAP